MTRDMMYGVSFTAIQLRDQALLMLEGRGAILDVAREVSRMLTEGDIAGGVIGGVAVTLHGHVRTTKDVDVFAPEPLSILADRLRAAGFEFDSHRREFSRSGVPVHLVSETHAKPMPTHFVTLNGIRTVSLADLINLKLTSGTRNTLRARDLADVVDLIRQNQLDGRFTVRIVKPLRDEFRRILQAIRIDSPPPPSGDPFSHLG